MIHIQKDPPKIHHSRLRAAIAAEIMELQNQRRATHDPFLRKTIDQKIKRLLVLLQKVATAALLAVLVMPSTIAHAQSAIVGRAPCSVYMDSSTCLRAIQNYSNQCLAERFPKMEPTAQQSLECVRVGLSKAGALDLLETRRGLSERPFRGSAEPNGSPNQEAASGGVSDGEKTHRTASHPDLFV